jgi:hypothetical protein
MSSVMRIIWNVAALYNIVLEITSEWLLVAFLILGKGICEATWRSQILVVCHHVYS